MIPQVHGSPEEHEIAALTVALLAVARRRDAAGRPTAPPAARPAGWTQESGLWDPDRRAVEL